MAETAALDDQADRTPRWINRRLCLIERRSTRDRLDQPTSPYRRESKDRHPVVLDFTGLLIGLVAIGSLFRLRDLWEQSALVVGPGLVVVAVMIAALFLAAVQTYRRRMLWLCLLVLVGYAAMVALGAINLDEPEAIWLTWIPLGFAAAIFTRRSAFES